ncbi:MAG: response regulator transcription factor [Gammaproteobacteria bacterium]|nr:response regulator transcription factor [Gammaproteobacteria bacterium]
MRILLVEDDIQLAEGLAASLRTEGYSVDLAADGIEAQYRGEESLYDGVVLDLGLPGRSGLEVLRHWRGQGLAVPVLILTARDSWQERVEGLQAGADDYLGKPFHQEELLARLQALLRRSGTQEQVMLSINGVNLDEQAKEVRLEERPVSLTATEYKLLRYLMRHAGEVLSKQKLYEAIYEWDEDRDINIIEVYIRRLRDKLGSERIETRRGQGYCFPITR